MGKFLSQMVSIETKMLLSVVRSLSYQGQSLIAILNLHSTRSQRGSNAVNDVIAAVEAVIASSVLQM